MRSFVCVLALSIGYLSTSAQETNNRHKNYVEIGYTGGLYSGAGAGGVYGAAGFFFKAFGKASSIDFRAKEIYISKPERESGALSLTYRLFLTKGYYLGAGFAHNHEVPFDKYKEDIVASSIGNGKYIIHRSGLAAETGYDFGSLMKKGWLGIYPHVNLSVAYMALDHEPNPLVTLSVGFRFGVKEIQE